MTRADRNESSKISVTGHKAEYAPLSRVIAADSIMSSIGTIEIINVIPVTAGVLATLSALTQL
jgi:hypothetical protein